MNCRHCRQPLQRSFLDLGSAPPSNAYLTATKLRAPELWYPLRLLVCETCWLVQTEDHAGRESLFTPDYAYFSSYSASWLAHANAYVQMAMRRFALSQSSCVVEVAANDGYLLQYVQAAGIPCYGIEPTAGTAAAARQRGLEIIEQFFEPELATRLSGENRQADLIVANNVLAHVPDINSFIRAFAILLKPSGVATFEFPHLLRMVSENQFDTAYHEHYSYLSLTTAERILSKNGLTIFDVEELPTHGGSLRVFAQRVDTGTFPVGKNVTRLRQSENDAGMKSARYYATYQECAESVKDALVSFLIEAKRADQRVGAYGAAAKGNTLLNFAGIRPDLIPYVVDRSPSKQGKYMPGSRIPIVSEDFLKADRPDLLLLLPWNLRDELTTQLEYARSWGARFVTAVPTLTVF